MNKCLKQTTRGVPTGTWMAVAASVALVACGGGTTRTPTPIDETTPVVTSFTPTTAVAGVPTTFKVVGRNLPLKAAVTLDGGTCASATDVTATGFTVVCTPGSATGALNAIINTDLLASGGWWMGQQALTISPGAVAQTLLSDTGVNANQCYAAGSDVLVSCTSTAALALNDKQDGMVGRDVVTPDSSDGLLGLSYSVDGATCVKDKITGLIWQRASTTLLALPGDTQNQEAAVLRSTANTDKVCGYTDWRLPTPAELQSLVNYGSSNASFAIDLNWFAATRSAWYITATPYKSGGSSNVWLVDFAKGRMGGIGAVSGTPELRLVR